MTWEYENEDYRPNKKERTELIRKRLAAVEDEEGQVLSPLAAPKRGNICQSFWGRNWCRHLESFSFWDHRLPRGRRLLRQGAVYGMSITPGMVHAYIAGADLFEADIRVAPVDPEYKSALIATVKASAVSQIDLWEGRLSNELLEQLTCRDYSLFPQPGDTRSICHCTDWADVCEHGAAVLYGCGLLFEENPALLFTLRGIDPDELIPPLNTESSPHSLPDTGLENIFGIEIQENE